jgi:predicted nucleic acid-binding protein
VQGRDVADHAMLLLDTSFLIEFEDELAHKKLGPAHGVLAARRRETVAISIITFGEFAEGFADPRALVEFLAPFRVATLSRAIAWRMCAIAFCRYRPHSQRSPGHNDRKMRDQSRKS